MRKLWEIGTAVKGLHLSLQKQNTNSLSYCYHCEVDLSVRVDEVEQLRPVRDLKS